MDFGFFQFSVSVLLNLVNHLCKIKLYCFQVFGLQMFSGPSNPKSLTYPKGHFPTPSLTFWRFFWSSVFKPSNFLSTFLFLSNTHTPNRGPTIIQIVERRAEPQWIVIKYHFHTHSSQFSSKSSARDLSLEAALRVVISPSCDTSIQSEAPTEPSGCMVRVLLAKRRTYAYAHFEPREPFSISPLPGWILA